MSNPPATSTTYAVLGLLAVRSWSTYELTRQVKRSLGCMWPSAESRLYEEPKKLVALGWATATIENVGKRPRTVYAITDQGRAAFADWLSEPGEGPVLEFEQLVKLAYADHGTRDDALRRSCRPLSQAPPRHADVKQPAYQGILFPDGSENTSPVPDGGTPPLRRTW